MIARARTSHPLESHLAAASVNTTEGQQLALRALRLFEHRARRAGRTSAAGATASQVRDLIRLTGHRASDSGPRSRLAELKAMRPPLAKVVGHDANRQALYALTDDGRMAAERYFREARAEGRFEQPELAA